jgi:hypothetical protein
MQVSTNISKVFLAWNYASSNHLEKRHDCAMNREMGMIAWSISPRINCCFLELPAI